MIIPKPFARVVIAVGSPRRVDRDLDDEGFESARAELETCLSELESASRNALGDRTPN